MQLKSVLLLTVFSFLVLSSCTEDYAIPEADCELGELVGNTSNPNSGIYQSILDNYAALGLPGISVAIETPGQGWWLGTAGMASIEEGVLMQPCHLHHSASMAKPYTATMIMSLVENGSLGLDDPIRDYLSEEMVSEIANADVATVRQVLNHTSGIFNFDGNMKLYVDTFNDPLVHTSIESVIEKYVYGMPAYNPAGEGFNYSNTNYSLLGMIIEEVSGMSLGDYFQQSISEVIGLQDTYYRSSPGYPYIEHTVNSYYEHFPGQIQNCSDIQMNFSKFAYGHEGIIATPYDYALFIRELMRGNILDSETISEMIDESNRSVDTTDYGLRFEYGLGLAEMSFELGSAYGHIAGSMGSIGYLLYFPDAEVTLCMASNLGGAFTSDNTNRFYKDLLNDLLDAIASEGL